MKRRYLLTIQKKFAVLFLLVGLIPVVLLVGVIVGASRISVAWGTAQALGPRVRETSDRIGYYCEHRHEELANLVRVYGGDIQKLKLDSAVRAGTAAIVHYRPGEEAVSLPVSPEHGDLARSMELYTEHYDTYFAKGAVPETGYWEDIRIETDLWVEGLGLVMSVHPEPSGGVVIFVIEGQEILDRSGLMLGQDSATLSLFSHRGYMLTRSPQTENLRALALENLGPDTAPHQGWFDIEENESGDGQWSLIAHAVVPRLSRFKPGGAVSPTWSVLFSYDMERFLAPLTTLVWTAVIGGAIWGLMLLGVATFSTRRVVGPVKSLRYQAEAMAAGDLSARARVRTGDEIEDLARAFNRMAEKLDTTLRDLEVRVEENRLRADHIRVINEITKAVTQALDLGRTFEILKRDLPSILQYDAMWIALASEEGKLRLTHAEPWAMLEEAGTGVVPLEYTFHGQALAEMRAIRGVIDAPLEESDPSHSGVFTALGFQAFLVAPLPSRDKPLGTLTVVSRKKDTYDAEAVEIISSVASAVAVGIEQAELFARAREFAEDLERKVAERTRDLERVNEGLVQTEKYAATGRLAANLAHEINNPLGIMKNYLRLTHEGLRESGGGRRETDPNVGHLEILDEEIDRVARIVRQLLDLHRPPDQNPRPTDIAALLSDILTLMEKELHKKRIKLECDLESDMPSAMVSPDLIQQVYLNLLRNAEDAMGGGGRLSVGAYATEYFDGKERVPAIAVSIEDTGCGMNRDTLRHIFDPFFTTKSKEQGTGLGLSVSYGIVQSYRGAIEVESEPGQGTKFTVTLPLKPRPRDNSLLTASADGNPATLQSAGGLALPPAADGP